MKSPLPTLLFGAALLALQAAPAHAQSYQPIYKCPDGKGQFTYTHVPCSNAKIIGDMAPKTSKETSRSTPVSQERARLAARAQLTPDQLEQCNALEGQMTEQQNVLKAKSEKGEPVTEKDEGVLVRLRLKHREAKCG